MDLRSVLLAEGDAAEGDTDLMVEGVRFWICARCGNRVKEGYCLSTNQETL